MHFSVSGDMHDITETAYLMGNSFFYINLSGKTTLIGILSLSPKPQVKYHWCGSLPRYSPQMFGHLLMVMVSHVNSLYWLGFFLPQLKVVLTIYICSWNSVEKGNNRIFEISHFSGPKHQQIISISNDINK